jgi:arylesterase/paraoxonase
MLKNMIVGLAVLAVLAALAVSFVMHRAGQFETLEPVALPSCRAVTGAPGAEDITVDRASGIAFISSFDRRAALAGRPRRGAIFAYDLNAPGTPPRELTADFKGDFNPHGISLYSGDDGAFLHVVNHPPKRHTIEIFAWLGGRLEYRETVPGELLVSPNDVLAVGPRSFYATNDHAHTEGLARILEDYLQRAESNVVYFDGDAMRVAATGIAYANGINMAPDGNEVYVAATTRGRVHVFGRDLATGALDPLEVLELGTGVDNIEIDRHGMLWIGAHPKLLSFVAHAGDPAKRSPSQVVWAHPDQALDPPVRTVFLSLGEELSGSSVGAPWGSRLLIGSVFEPHFLDCERAPLRSGLPPIPRADRIATP